MIEQKKIAEERRVDNSHDKSRPASEIKIKNIKKYKNTKKFIICIKLSFVILFLFSQFRVCLLPSPAFTTATVIKIEDSQLELPHSQLDVVKRIWILQFIISSRARASLSLESENLRGTSSHNKLIKS